MLAQEEVIMMKGKRSKRPRLTSPSPLALTIATSSSSGDGVITDVSPSNSYELTHSAAVEEEEDMANCLILLAKGQGQRSTQPVTAAEAYQCKTCSKSFPSFQALGGHRASHKKPNKPTNIEERKSYALMREKQEGFMAVESDDTTNLSLQISNCRSASSASLHNKTRVHECSICGAEFGSGQALGGHMRRHRQIPAAASGEPQPQGVKKPRNLLSLDLNLPAPEDDHLIVFAASPLVDCHY